MNNMTLLNSLGNVNPPSFNLSLDTVRGVDREQIANQLGIQLPDNVTEAAVAVLQTDPGIYDLTLATEGDTDRDYYAFFTDSWQVFNASDALSPVTYEVECHDRIIIAVYDAGGSRAGKTTLFVKSFVKKADLNIGYPPHRWDGTNISFLQPDGNWGDWVNLQGYQGVPGADGKDGIDGVDFGADSAILTASPNVSLDPQHTLYQATSVSKWKPLKILVGFRNLSAVSRTVGRILNIRGVIEVQNIDLSVAVKESSNAWSKLNEDKAHTKQLIYPIAELGHHHRLESYFNPVTNSAGRYLASVPVYTSNGLGAFAHITDRFIGISSNEGLTNGTTVSLDIAIAQ